ncbi:glutamate receptor ionotropic, delta-1-like [Oratosquilla oratoria]|uniref:glutamate receptor ionotropic, delta-1-like n=1 Tax=Oratosquilla oratoria TaxID=337810 RepID=UPI003F76DCB3
MALVLSAFKLASPSTSNTQGSKFSSTRALNPLAVLNDGLEWSFGVLLMQSLSWTSRSSSSSGLLVGVWILLSFIVSTMYKCNLKAMLISPKIVLPFDSFEELVARGDYNYVIVYHSVLHTIMKKAEPDSLMGKAYRKKSGFVYNDVVKGARDTGNGKFAILVDGTIARTAAHISLMMTGRCKIAFTRGKVPVWFLPSMFFTKGSPLLEETNKIIRRLKDFGIIDQWIKDLFLKGQVCFTPGDAEAQIKERALALYDFYGVFILWATGLCIAIIIFLLELVI